MQLQPTQPYMECFLTWCARSANSVSLPELKVIPLSGPDVRTSVAVKQILELVLLVEQLFLGANFAERSFCDTLSDVNLAIISIRFLPYRNLGLGELFCVSLVATVKKTWHKAVGRVKFRAKKSSMDA